MVNQILVDYIKNNNDKFSLEEIKKQIISRGYPEKDFNEASSFVQMQGAVINFPSFAEPKKGFKLMRISGIIGLIFCLLVLGGVIFTLAGFFNDIEFTGDSGSMTNIFLALGVAVLFILSAFVYLFGFVKLSHKTESRLLRFASISSIVLLAMMIILSIVVPIFLMNVVGSIKSDLSSADSLMNAQAMGSDFDNFEEFDGSIPVSGNAVSDLSADSRLPGGGIAILILVAFAVFYLFCIVVRFCWSIGLIKIRKKVSFSFFAGILDLILIALLTLIFLLFVYFIFSPLALIPLAFMPPEGMYIFSILMWFISFFALIFESLTLLFASKKFE